MEQENYEDLTKSLYYKGFGEAFNAELEREMKSGKKEFSLERQITAEGDEIGQRVHFRRDDNKDKVYLNEITLAYLNAPEGIREHTFSAQQQITAMEGHRMLKHGLLVAVNKDLYNREGERYNTWIAIDVKGTKDQYNNYPVHTHHEKYYSKKPFDIQKELRGLPVPVKELENPYKGADYEKLLKKAGLIDVTIIYNGQEMKGKLSVNPESGRVNVHDKDMHIIESSRQQQTSVELETSGQTQNGQKKKPGVNLHQNHGQSRTETQDWKKDQNKGMSVH